MTTCRSSPDTRIYIDTYFLPTCASTPSLVQAVSSAARTLNADVAFIPVGYDRLGTSSSGTALLDSAVATICSQMVSGFNSSKTLDFLDCLFSPNAGNSGGDSVDYEQRMKTCSAVTYAASEVAQLTECAVSNLFLIGDTWKRISTAALADSAVVNTSPAIYVNGYYYCATKGGSPFASSTTSIASSNYDPDEIIRASCAVVNNPAVFPPQALVAHDSTDDDFPVPLVNATTWSSSPPPTPAISALGQADAALIGYSSACRFDATCENSDGTYPATFVFVELVPIVGTMLISLTLAVLFCGIVMRRVRDFRTREEARHDFDVVFGRRGMGNGLPPGSGRRISGDDERLHNVMQLLAELQLQMMRSGAAGGGSGVVIPILGSREGGNEDGRLTEERIEAGLKQLPVRLVDDPNAPDPCAICLEEVESYCYALSCEHVFHPACLRDWLEKGRKNECCVCRGPIFPLPPPPSSASHAETNDAGSSSHPPPPPDPDNNNNNRNNTVSLV